MQWYLKVLKNYAGFQGRASRQEYWMFQLFNVSIYGVLLLLATASESNFLSVLMVIYYLGIIVPSLAVSVRRLHDIGKSGWAILVSLIPFVGGILLLVWSCTDSQPNDNQYGPNPKNGVSQSAQPQFAASVETVFCTECGTKTPVGKFCTKCGTELKI